MQYATRRPFRPESHHGRPGLQQLWLEDRSAGVQKRRGAGARSQASTCSIRPTVTARAAGRLGNRIEQGAGSPFVKRLCCFTKFGVGLVNARTRDSSRGYVMTAVEGSLRRLNTDWIDVYMIHWPDYSTPMEETSGRWTISSGAARSATSPAPTSRHGAWSMRSGPPGTSNLDTFIAAQDHYNLLKRDSEKDLIRPCSTTGWDSFRITRWRADC